MPKAKIFSKSFKEKMKEYKKVIKVTRFKNTKRSMKVSSKNYNPNFTIHNSIVI